MQNKAIAFTGLLAVILFVAAATLGGFQFDNYNPLSQLISETAAVDAPYGKLLRFAGYIPAGILLTVFYLLAIGCFPRRTVTTIGFIGLAIFYGIGTLLIGIFPCDAGCNKGFIDPSTSQLIHVAVGMLTYLFVPLSLLLIGFSLRRTDPKLSSVAIACALVAYALLAFIIITPETGLTGLWQRIIEGSFVVWTVTCAGSILKERKNRSAL